MSIIDSIKSSLFVSIHPAGMPFIVIFSVVTVLLGWIWSPLFLIGIIITIWCIYFFRNPVRIIPDDIENKLLIAPADGKIVEISELIPDEEISLPNKKFFKVGIFMSVFDVHINRSPMKGKIINKNYIPGLFFNASLDKASKENERLCFTMDIGQSRKIAFVQIAGLIARRIVSNIEVGSELSSGEVFGLIRFGSRVDIYFPDDSILKVLNGQTMIAGETVIAELKENKVVKKAKK